jgi:hypothetical protein
VFSVERVCSWHSSEKEFRRQLDETWIGCAHNLPKVGIVDLAVHRAALVPDRARNASPGASPDRRAAEYKKGDDCHPHNHDEPVAHQSSMPLANVFDSQDDTLRGLSLASTPFAADWTAC